MHLKACLRARWAVFFKFRISTFLVVVGVVVVVLVVVGLGRMDCLQRVKRTILPTRDLRRRRHHHHKHRCQAHQHSLQMGAAVVATVLVAAVATVVMVKVPHPDQRRCSLDPVDHRPQRVHLKGRTMRQTPKIERMLVKAC